MNDRTSTWPTDCDGSPLDPGNLDPGIRDRVLEFIAAGFMTTDSGDGVSKAGSGQIYNDVPHIVISSTYEEIRSLHDRVEAFVAERHPSATVTPLLYKHEGIWGAMVLVEWLSADELRGAA